MMSTGELPREIEPRSDESADLYEFVYDADRAARDAERLHHVLEAAAPAATSLLDVACGTGWHLERLRTWYAVEGIDASPGMLRLARQRLANVVLHQADMRSFRLPRRFDVITCLSSSIAHMQTLADLSTAVARMAEHLSDTGVLIIEPWDFPEETTSARPWVMTAQTDDCAVALLETTTLHEALWHQETHFLVWRKTERIEHLRERNTLGAFTKREHVQALESEGLSVRFDENRLLGRGLFIASRTAG